MTGVQTCALPISYLIERHGLSRHRATLIAGCSIAAFSGLIALNFERLFGLVITISTRYGQPLLGIIVCLFAGWLWHRDALLAELKKNDTAADQRWFWKIWPLYVKWICPIIIGVILVRSIL